MEANEKPILLDRPVRMRIAKQAGTDERTVLTAYGGLPVRPITLWRISRAARTLGLPMPPGGREALEVNHFEEGK